jgi:Tfp pilus assembly protein PilF
VTLIVDALRRHPAEPIGRGKGQTAGAPGALALKPLLVYAVAAVAIGFLGTAAVLLLLAPGAAPHHTATLTTAPSRVAPTKPPRQPSRGPDVEVAPRPAPPAPPVKPIDHFGLALQYQRLGQFDRALAQYRILLARHDDSAEIHDNLGLLYADHGDAANAMAEFRRALDIDPGSVKAHNNLGVTLMRAGRLTDAAAEFHSALAPDPDSVEPLVNLALVQKAAGRLPEARELLERAVRLDPRSAGAHYNLAVVADETGDSSLAIEHYRAYLNCAPSGDTSAADRVRARLAALGG